MRFDRFSERSQDAAMRAYEIMQRFGHGQVDVEHMFLALLTQPQGKASELLERLNVPVESLRARLVANLESSPRSPAPAGAGEANQVFITPRLKRVVDRATEEARQLQDELQSTEHLLLGIASESRGFSCGLLSEAHITHDRILRAVKQDRGLSTSQSHETSALVAPLLIPRQRQVLTTLRSGVANRSTSEPQIESRFGAQGQTAQSVLGQKIEDAGKQLTEVTRSQERTPEILASAALQEIWARSQPVTPRRPSAAQPSQALAQAVKAADQSFASLSNAADALEAERRARSNQRTAKVVMAVIGVLAIVVAGIMGYRALRAESLYRAATAALEAGNWKEARTQFAELGRLRGLDLTLLDEDPSDAQALLLLIEYPSALDVLLKTNDWEKAKAEIDLPSDQAEQTLTALVVWQVKKEAELGGWDTYEVKPGDMIDVVAKKLGVNSNDLKMANRNYYPHIYAGRLSPGWLILVPK